MYDLFIYLRKQLQDFMFVSSAAFRFCLGFLLRSFFEVMSWPRETLLDTIGELIIAMRGFMKVRGYFGGDGLWCLFRRM